MVKLSTAESKKRGRAFIPSVEQINADKITQVKRSMELNGHGRIIVLKPNAIDNGAILWSFSYRINFGHHTMSRTIHPLTRASLTRFTNRKY